jgi:hypothetical protein
LPNEGQTCMCGDRNGYARCSCPTAIPVDGSPCSGPVGPDYSGCAYGDKLCDCVNSLWRCGFCPINVPTNRSPCSSQANCSYPTAFCYCDGQSWSCS